MYEHRSLVHITSDDEADTVRASAADRIDRTHRYQIILDRVNNTDTFDVNVEMTPELFCDTVKGTQEAEKKLVAAMLNMLGIRPNVHLVAPKSITRSEGKAVRVIDKRKLHG
jgi:phenylacetate-CoA ligase